MKWFEIFKSKTAREEAPPELTVEAPANRKLIAEPFGSPRSEAAMEVTPIALKAPSLSLPAGYFYPDATEAARLHAELLSALTDAHSLFSVPLETFAARQDNGAALFRFRGNPQRYALVDLSGARATGAENPAVLFAGSFAEFLAHTSKN